MAQPLHYKGTDTPARPKRNDMLRSNLFDVLLGILLVGAIVVALTPSFL